MRHCETVRFGPFELDVASRELCVDGRRIRLQDQPFEILHAMLERPGEVVTRETLRRRLWPDGTFVDFEHSLNAAIKRLRAALGDDADNPRYVETLPRRGYRFIATVGSAIGDHGSGVRGSDPRARIPHSRSPVLRLAVLPFTNLSGDPAEDYFSAGLTDELIAQVGRLCRGRVGVIARSSTMPFKDAAMGAREIGETLRVDHLLEGSVRRDGDRVRMTARLIAAEDETQVWADTYERALTDDCATASGGRLSVQSDVALRIARALSTELAPDTHARMLRTTPPAAYQALLKGRYYWNMAADVGLDQAIASFEQALAEAPSFATAMSALARAQVGRAEFYRECPRQALDAARSLATRALAIDPDLSEAYVALADATLLLDWNWTAAERAYRQAQSLNPSNVAAYRGYARLLAERGEGEVAARMVERAFELDPLCLDAGVCAAWIRYVSCDAAAAIDYCRNTLDIDDQFVPAWRALGAAALAAGRHDEAIEALRRAARLSERSPLSLLALAHGLAATGAQPEARTLLEIAGGMAAHCYVPAYHRALVHAELGECDAAFAALDAALADRDPALGYLAVDPRLKALRADSRFARLAASINLG
jgi:TolB-like protein/Tfp pilus assembly protein PilF